MKMKNQEYKKEDLAASFLGTVVDILCDKTLDAAVEKNVKTIMLAGGVAANSRLRAILAERSDIHCIFPPLKLCGDNGAMIAGVAYHFLMRGERSGLTTTASARIPQFKRGLEQLKRRAARHHQ